MKRAAWQILKWVLGVGIVAGILWWNRARIEEMLNQRDRFEPTQLVIAGCIFLCATLLTFVRWHLLVRAQELPFRLIDAVRLGFVSLFFSSFLPGSVGGDLVKAGFLAREQSRRTVAISTIVVDRVMGLAGLILLAALAGAVFWADVEAVTDREGNHPLQWIVLFVWGLTGAMGLAAVVLALLPVHGEGLLNRLFRIPYLGRALGEILKAFQMYRHKYRSVGLALGLAMIGHVGFVLSFYFAARALPPPIPSLQEHLLLIPAGMVVEAIPVTPGNIGFGEAAYGFLYDLVDSSSGEYDGKGALARLGQRLVTWFIALIGLGFYLPLRGTVKRLSERETRPEN